MFSHFDENFLTIFILPLQEVNFHVLLKKCKKIVYTRTLDYTLFNYYKYALIN